jgi:hypothetical protein
MGIAERQCRFRRLLSYSEIRTGSIKPAHLFRGLVREFVVMLFITDTFRASATETKNNLVQLRIFGD